MKKTISLLLAVFMLVSCVPIFASAEAIALTRDNITEWPTLVNKDGSEPTVQLYCGQKYADYWALKGGEVRYDSNGNGELEDTEIVAGAFVFNNTEEMALNSGTYIWVNFIPEDQSNYTIIEKVTYGPVLNVGELITVTPEILEMPVASDVESGARLSTSTLSGGVAKNPITDEIITDAEWNWVSRRTKVTASGYYEAELVISNGYEILTKLIYVRIAGDTSEIPEVTTTVVEVPKVVGTYKLGDDWSAVEFAGGKVLDDVNGTTVSGKFSINNTGTIARYGTFDISVVFIPDNATFAPTIATTSITVEKLKINFIDADGNEIVPEISTIPEAVFGETTSIDYSLYSYLPCKQNSFEYFDMEGNSLEGTKVPMGRNEIKVKVSTKDTNYEATTLSFILNVEPKTFTATANYNQYNKEIKVYIDNKVTVPGEFDVYVDGELIGTTTDKVIKWSTNVSDTYDVELVYKDEEGRYALENSKQEMTVSIRRQVWRGEALSFTVTGGDKSNNNYAYAGNVLTVECADAAFYNWKITANGEDYLPEGLTAEDLTKSSISFTMPDHDIVITANSAEDYAADANCDHLCHRTGFVSYIWKVISFLQRLFGVQQYCDCGIMHYDEPILNLGL
ncbi:MAG: hypothetical protein IJW86_06130 [Clostridia bacterium]|nr:hypothetical protein [Clostridia bacterium]